MMKTLSNLKADAADLQTAATHTGRTITNSQTKFSRRSRHSKNLITFESSAGGLVQVPMTELWKLVEGVDEKLKAPAAPALAKG
jgi:hypothetical protein